MEIENKENISTKQFKTMPSSLSSTSNPPVAAIQVPPPSRLHQRPVSRQVHTAPRSMMHHKWTMSESYDESLNSAVGTTTPPRNCLRRNLFSPEKQASMMNKNNNTPLRASNDVIKTPQRSLHRATPKRGNSGEYCGLTAEITRELNQRSAKKTPRTTRGADLPDASVTFVGVMTSANGMQTPPRVNRKQQDFQDDIFRMPKDNELVIAPTISASSSDDVSPKEICHHLPPVQEQTDQQQVQPPPPSSKKKRGITTPIRIPKKTIFSSAKKIKKCLTPPREGFGSHLKSLSYRRKLDAKEFGGATQFDGGDAATSSPGSTLSTALPGVDDFKIHSTEYDPFDFQCEIPPKREIATHAKICNVVDSYTAIHLNFNFAILAGLTRKTLEKEYERTSDEKPMIAGSCHREVVKGVLECEDDLVVEGFFREYVGDCRRVDTSTASVVNGSTPKAAKATGAASNGKDDRIEVIIFSSEKLRQIIVCYRGSTASQAKPLKMNYFGKEGKICLIPCPRQVVLSLHCLNHDSSMLSIIFRFIAPPPRPSSAHPLRIS
ncbi:hypothetical protein ACHAWX_004122 [Stephanocyclus meneghinianus]